MTFDQMTPEERLTLAGLARLMVRADNQFSSEEASALSELAAEIGEDGFWAEVDRAAELDPDAIRGLTSDVTRRTAQEFIYGHLFALGLCGTLVAEEAKLLDWLADLWKLETEGGPYRT